jgi:SAM-dependent MidA family methyltransferase
LNDSPLKTLLLNMLRQSGPMNFERYMELCLYHPEFGYYMQAHDRTGVEGDYFTSPDLHPVFARLVARQAAEMWEILERPARFSFVEMGAGRGLFAVDFLRWAKASGSDFYEALEYVVVEAGPRQRARVLERVAREGPESPRFATLASLEELEPVTGCFFSNELVDAFPVSVVTRARGRLKEIYVEAHGDRLRETLGPITDSAVAAAVARYANQLDEGHRVEVNRKATLWLHTVAEKLNQGFVVTIDYGGPAGSLHTSACPRGTLMAYRGHKATEDFYDAPGEQDLTAHVNFSALIDCGKEAGLTCAGLTTQERFLMALGEGNEFADVYDAGQTEDEKLQARLKLKRLIFPGGAEGSRGMGSIFKVLIQYRGVITPRLTGLKFQQVGACRRLQVDASRGGSL